MSLMVSISGVRGIVGDSLTPTVAREFAAAYGVHLRGGDVVLGRDSRASGLALRDVVAEELCRAGCAVRDLGVATTPGVALMTRRNRAAGGLVITASHNPGQWNGLKFLTSKGCAPRLEDVRPIWLLREQAARVGVGGTAAKKGSVSEDQSADPVHVAEVLRIIRKDEIASWKFRVVLDSVNGAGGRSGLLLLEALGCEVVHLNGEATGEFAHLPEPTAENLTDLCGATRRVGADVAFAQDPDADRLAVVDEQGSYIGEEYTLALAALQVFGQRPGPAAANMSTSRMIDDLAARRGPPCGVHRTAVGEANVVAAIERHGCVIGGEGNGGVIDPRVVLVRDSLTAMALILQLLADRGRPLSRIVESMPRYAMVKQKMECSAEQIGRALQAVRARFSDQRIDGTDGVRIDWPEGWVHIRGSNTEPILRLIAEARDQQTARALIEQVRQAAGME